MTSSCLKLDTYYTFLLTLKGLSLFFKILSKHWCLCGIYFVYCSLSLLLQTWLLIRHGVLLLPTCLPGLERPQALIGINSNAMLSFFDCSWGKQNDTHDFGFYSKGNGSATVVSLLHMDCSCTLQRYLVL